MSEDEVSEVLVMAPEYFPGLDLCAAMCQSAVIKLDCTRQYVRQSYQNRMKVRTPDGWQWLTIPLAGHQHGRKVAEVEVSENKDWRKIHLQSLRYNYRSSPFYDFVEPGIISVLYNGTQHFSGIVVASTMLVIELLGIAAEIKVVESEGTDGGPIPGRQLMIDRLAAPGEVYREVRMADTSYRQNFDGFEPGLSSLDLIFNYGPEAFSVLQSRIVT